MPQLIILLLSLLLAGCGEDVNNTLAEKTLSTNNRPTSVQHFHLRLDRHQASLSNEQKQKISAFMKDNYTNQSIQIIGHAEDGGSTQYNYILSYQRAEAVKEHLKIINIPAVKIETFGYGSSRNKAPGSLLLSNRFIEINLMEDNSHESI